MGSPLRPLRRTCVEVLGGDRGRDFVSVEPCLLRRPSRAATGGSGLSRAFSRERV